MEQEFTVLENKVVGRNLSNFRRLREKKAMEIAEHLRMSEANYSKYERGESKITIDIIQKVAEYLKVDPMQIIASNPGNIIKNVHNSSFVINPRVNTSNEKLTDLITKLIETQISMNEKMVALLEKSKE